MADQAPRQAAHLRVRPDWLARTDEPVIEPDLPLIDPHHHLWDRPGWPYGLDELLADLASGHRVVSTIFAECRTRYRDAGPTELRSVGEVEFARSVATEAERRGSVVRVCEGIIAHADLRRGVAVGPVIEALKAASGGRLRGVRHSTAWDPDPVIANPELATRPGMLVEPAFQDGVRLLGASGLVFDAWVYHPQLAELAALAEACPDTQIVLNHAGGPVGVGRYAADHERMRQEWHAGLRLISQRQNIAIKLGGLAMRISGQRFHERPSPPGSEELAAAWQKDVHLCLELFRPVRCMFESNFPVDKGSYGYRVLWNAFKRLAADLSPAGQHEVLAGTAARIYGLLEPVNTRGEAG